MKSYPHIYSELFCKPLIVTRARHAAMVRILESRLQGGLDIADSRSQIAKAIGKRVDDNPDLDLDGTEFTSPPGWETVGSDAIIPVHGVLVGHASDIPMSSCGCGLDGVSSMIDMALADEEVTQIIFDFRTPGGAVCGIPELGRKIGNITTKRTIGFTDSECCSGGLWLAMQCQHFFGTASSTIGSIGVWCAYLDISRQMQNEGQNVQEISAGKWKTMGASWKPLTLEEKTVIQADVDRIYGQFKEAVNYRRQVSEEFMEGQVFDGEQAVEAGLCDGLVEGIDELLSEDAPIGNK